MSYIRRTVIDVSDSLSRIDFIVISNDYTKRLKFMFAHIEALLNANIVSKYDAYLNDFDMIGYEPPIISNYKNVHYNNIDCVGLIDWTNEYIVPNKSQYFNKKYTSNNRKDDLKKISQIFQGNGIVLRGHFDFRDVFSIGGKLNTYCKFCESFNVIPISIEVLHTQKSKIAVLTFGNDSSK